MEIYENRKLSSWFLELDGQPLECYYRNLLLSKEDEDKIVTVVGGSNTQDSFGQELVNVVGQYIRHPIY